MLFRFTGTYTGGRTSITVFGVTFEGHEPADVTDEDGIRRLSGHQEFEQVTKTVTPELEAAMAEYEDSIPEQPKKRGRPRKAG
jgi:hypothetical protein